MPKARPAAEVAKEQLEKQEARVARLRKKVDELDRELRQARIELSNDEQILVYYAQHPALDPPSVERPEIPEDFGSEIPHRKVEFDTDDDAKLFEIESLKRR